MRSRKLDGERLRSFREDAWLTQGELAGMAGVSRQTIADMENGRRPYPKGSTMLHVAEALEVEREDLLEEGIPLGVAGPAKAGARAEVRSGHDSQANAPLFRAG